MRTWEALVIAAALCGCSSGPQQADNSSATPTILFQSGRNSWLIVDKADKAKIVVQRDPMSASARKSRAVLSQGDYEQAGAAFLTKAGRRCRVGQGSLVIEHTWEFAYACDAQPVVTGTVPKK